jgi:predicted MFS family arabinose efflux permease
VPVKALIKNKLPKTLYVLSISAFLFHLARTVTQPIFSLYILDLGASIVQVGFIISIHSFLMIFLRLPLTFIAQKLTEERMLIISYVVQSTVQLFYYLAKNPILLYFIPFYQIIASGTFFQLATSMASKTAPSSMQGEALGRYMMISSLSMIIGPFILSSLVREISIRQLFLVSSIFPIVGLVLLSHYLNTVKKTSTTQDIKEKFDISSSFKKILKERNIIILSVIRTIYSISNNIFTILFAVYIVKDIGFSPSTAALLFSIMGLANTIIKVPAGILSDKFGRKKVLIITFILIILDYAAISYSKNLIIIAFLLAVFGACWGMRAVTEWSFLTSLVSHEIRTISISYMESFWDAGAAIGSLVAGILAVVFRFNEIFLILAFFNLFAIPFILIIVPPRNQIKP